MVYSRSSETRELANTLIELNGYKIVVSLLDRKTKHDERVISASARMAR